MISPLVELEILNDCKGIESTCIPSLFAILKPETLALLFINVFEFVNIPEKVTSEPIVKLPMPLNVPDIFTLAPTEEFKSQSD